MADSLIIGKIPTPNDKTSVLDADLAARPWGELMALIDQVTDQVTIANAVSNNGKIPLRVKVLTLYTGSVWIPDVWHCNLFNAATVDKSGLQNAVLSDRFRPYREDTG